MFVMPCTLLCSKLHGLGFYIHVQENFPVQVPYHCMFYEHCEVGHGVCCSVGGEGDVDHSAGMATCSFRTW